MAAAELECGRHGRIRSRGFPRLPSSRACRGGGDAVCRLLGLSKRFGRTVALEDVSFAIRRGSVHGFFGENGAGKSTLINIIGGAIAADDGDILFGFTTLASKTPLDARRAGISVVHQEFPQCEHMTVAENLFLASSPQGGFAVIRHEGVVPGPYLDMKGVWTFGIGHTAAAGGPDPGLMPRDSHASEQFHLAATAQNLRKLAKLVPTTSGPEPA